MLRQRASQCGVDCPRLAKIMTRAKSRSRKSDVRLMSTLRGGAYMTIVWKIPQETFFSEQQ